MADLVTIEEYKTYKKINSTSSDTQISSIITMVSKLVRNYCGRNFIDYYAVDKVEYFDANAYYVVVDEFPLVSVTSVEVSDDGGQTYTALTEYTDYYVDIENDTINAAELAFLTTAIPYRSLKVTYKAGYAATPDDLKLAVMDFIDYYRDEQFTSTKQTMSATIEYSPAKMPNHIKRVLDLYREVI